MLENSLFEKTELKTFKFKHITRECTKINRYNEKEQMITVETRAEKSKETKEKRIRKSSRIRKSCTTLEEKEIDEESSNVTSQFITEETSEITKR